MSHLSDQAPALQVETNPPSPADVRLEQQPQAAETEKGDLTILPHGEEQPQLSSEQPICQQQQALPNSQLKSDRTKPFPLLSFCLPVAALGLVGFLVRALVRRKRVETVRSSRHRADKVQDNRLKEEEQEEPAAPDTLNVMLLPLDLSSAASSSRPATQHKLSGTTFVVAENVDVVGTSTTFGHEINSQNVRQSEPLISSSSAAPVTRLLAAGSSCVGKSCNQPFGLDLIGANVGNPLNKAYISGGGCTGAAVAVASEQATFALAPDYIGEARVPAACCGLYCFRPTSMPIVAPGLAACQREPVSVLARDTTMLLQAAEGLGITGSKDLRSEIIKFVVAEDLFALCGVEFQPAALAMKKAIIDWAGPEQAGAVQLCEFLAKNTEAWQRMAPWRSSLEHHQTLPMGLEAFRTAALILRRQHLASKLPVEPGHDAQHASSVDLLPNQGAATSNPGLSVAAADNSAQPNDADQAPATSQTADSISTLLGPAPSAAQLQTAEEVAKQLFDILRQTVKPDTVMVIPATPFAPLHRTADAAQQDAFTSLCEAFACIPTLANCPSVTVPIGQVVQGLPLAVQVFAVHKFDMRLLAVVQEMAPRFQASFQQVIDDVLERMRQEQQQEEEPASSSVSQPASGLVPSGRKSTSGPPPAVAHASQPDPRKLEKADKHKARGNEYLKAGRFQEALTEYSKAIAEVPNNHIYYNNRAMACLKLFRFEQAEDDCNKVLSFSPDADAKAKALLRRGTARTALQKLDLAEKDFTEVLRIQPNNRQAREELQNLRQLQAEMQAATQQLILEQRRQALAAGLGGAAGALPVDMRRTVDPSLFPPGVDPALFDLSEVDPGMYGLLDGVQDDDDGEELTHY